MTIDLPFSYPLLNLFLPCSYLLLTLYLPLFWEGTVV